MQSNVKYLVTSFIASSVAAYFLAVLTTVTIILLWLPLVVICPAALFIVGKRVYETRNVSPMDKRTAIYRGIFAPLALFMLFLLYPLLIPYYPFS